MLSLPGTSHWEALGRLVKKGKQEMDWRSAAALSALRYRHDVLAWMIESKLTTKAEVSEDLLAFSGTLKRDVFGIADGIMDYLSPDGFFRKKIYGDIVPRRTSRVSRVRGSQGQDSRAKNGRGEVAFRPSCVYASELNEVERA
jgi:hypothetical protein